MITPEQEQQWAERYGRDAWAHGQPCDAKSYSDRPHIQTAWVRGWMTAESDQRVRRGEPAIGVGYYSAIPVSAPRATKLKVYLGNKGGTHEIIMATTSFQAFSKATGVLRDWSSITGNQEHVQTAMGAPGTIFRRSFADRHGPWETLQDNLI